MITIEIYKSNKKIENIIISGHSGYEEIGKDIVCSGISSLFCAAVNTFDSINEQRIEAREGFSSINMQDLEISDHDKVVLEVMLNGFRDIAKEYAKYVKILKKEKKHD